MGEDRAPGPAPAVDLTVSHRGTSKRLCVLVGCERRHNAKGYCARHYRRLLLYGDPLAYAPKPPKVIPTPAQMHDQMTAALEGLCDDENIERGIE